MAIQDLDVMKALSGTNSRQIADQVGKHVNDHRDVIGKLKTTAGVDAKALGEYASKVDRLDTLLRNARSETSLFGEAGQEISGNERTMLTEATAQVGKAGAQDFKVKLEDQSTVARGEPKAEDKITTGGKTNDGTVKDAAADDVYKTSGGKTYREGANSEAISKSGAVIREGDSGAAVTDAQKLLAGIKGSDGNAKYDLGKFGDKSDGIDGKLGPQTKSAIEQFKKDQGLKSDGKGTIDKETLERLTAVNGMAALDEPAAKTTGGKTTAAGEQKTAPKTAAQDLKDAFASGDTAKINKQLGGMNADQLQAARKELGTKPLETMIGKANEINKQGGLDSDYREALQASVFGDRKALGNKEVAAFTEQLKSADTAPNIFAQGLKAIGMGGGGTDETKMNKLFDLDNASLKKVDAELRKSYPGGLREFINSEYGSGDQSTHTRDLFMNRFDAAGL